MSYFYDQAVSWSKYGIILHSDGPNVGLTYLENLNGKNWRIAPSKWYKISKKSDATNTLKNEADPVNAFSNTLDISHIQFNNWATLPGETAAVIDIAGNVTLVTLGYEKERVCTFDNLTISFQDIAFEVPGSNDPVDTKSNGSTYYDLKYFANQISNGFDGKYIPGSQNSIKHENLDTSKIPTSILSFQWVANSKKVMTSKLQATWKTSVNGDNNNLLKRSVQVNKLQFNNLPLFGCYYPHYIKHVFSAVRKNSDFVLWYNFLNSRTTRKVTCKLDEELGNLLLDDSQIAYCQESNCFLISTLQKDKGELKIYKLTIDWNLKQYQLLQQKQEENHPNINANELPHPILKSEHLLTFNLDTEINGMDANFVKHYFLNRSYDDSCSPDAELVIQYELKDLFTGVADTILKRYVVKKLSPTTLSNNIPLGQNANFKMNKYQLTHIADSEFIGKKILQLDFHSILELITIRFENGDIETLKRSTWQNTSKKLDLLQEGGGLINGNLDISTPLETGFKFENLLSSNQSEEIEWCILSPLAAGLLYKFKNKSELKFTSYSPIHGKYDTISEIQVTALAHNFVHSTTHQPCGGEDVTLAISNFLDNIPDDANSTNAKKDILFLVLKTCFKFFGFLANSNTDYIQKILVTKPMQKLILLHLELSLSVPHNENSTVMVRILLQLRTFWFAISQVSKTVTQAVTNMNNIQQQQDKSNGDNISILSLTLSYTKQDSIESILTFSEWFFKLLNLINKEMIVLLNEKQDKNSQFVLAVLGSKLTRSMLLANITELKKLSKIIIQFKETNVPILQQSSNIFLDLINENSKLLATVEDYLLKLDEGLKKNEADEVANSNNNGNGDIKLDGAFKETLIFSKGEIHKSFKFHHMIVLNLFKTIVLPSLDINKVLFLNDDKDLKLFSEEFLTNRELSIKKFESIKKGVFVENYNEEFYRNYNFNIDDITKEKIHSKKYKKQLKQCNRCNSVTISSFKSPNKPENPLEEFDDDNYYYFNRHMYNGLSPNLISRRWNSTYYQICICSGVLKTLPDH